MFYEDGDHPIDFIYSIAKWLSPQSYVNSCYLILNTLQNEISVDYRETICTVGMEKFVKHLLSMQIGAPISSPEIGGFLSTLVRKAAEESGEEPPILDIPIFDERLNSDNDSFSGGYRILLIDTTENS